MQKQSVAFFAWKDCTRQLKDCDQAPGASKKGGSFPLFSTASEHVCSSANLIPQIQYYNGQ